MPELPHASEYRKYLEPRTLAKISALDLRARLIVEGLMNGMHRSPYQGISVEFAQHRPYVSGDDTRHVELPAEPVVQHSPVEPFVIVCGTAADLEHGVLAAEGQDLRLREHRRQAVLL